MKTIDKFIHDQLSVWPMAAANFRALKTVETKELKVGGQTVRVQFNPGRVASSTATTDPADIASRPCYLCPENRPQEQFHIKFEGRKGRMYNIQINPYPIFPRHLVIVSDRHIRQTIWHHYPDMLDFSRKYSDYTAFYNGPDCGASLPEHMHFQACPMGMAPLQVACDKFLDNPGEPITTVKDASLYHFNSYTRGVFCLKSTTSKSLAKLFYRLLDCSPWAPEDPEPKFNIFVWSNGDEYRTAVFLRDKVRSHHYFSDGEDHLTISPGAADMAGVFVAPFKEDFIKADEFLLEEMLSEVSISEKDEQMTLWRLSRTQRTIDVGIMSAPKICFEIISDGAGPQTVTVCDGRINYNGMLYDELYFESVMPSTLFAEPSFILYGVTIGIDFHWQRKTDQKFAGALRFIVENDRITAINRIGMEDYLLSVISSEMKASCPLESLKAHAVISRSWLLARVNERESGCDSMPHANFDVCADDHCQRYQGLTMATGNAVRQAIDETWGKVLRYGGDLCDTRYSKCCGGRTELFSTCWEDRDYPYLRSVVDPFCDCDDDTVLSTVLNDYDLQTRDFHDWEVRYSREEISKLFRERTGTDLGTIQELVPQQRGESGRIKYLLVKGTAGETVIGKELAIRRALSPSHLKSSAFEVLWEGDTLILRGKGWGHGVGLCQIGAAVMASKGYTYEQILKHYYEGAVIE
ncbi:MAG: DUF4922 domain-containing protein [Bacteroidales bacterium]|nr:DUF4922 domain-containing protein [Bacteroidales bacterium]